jgi:hypothetical protein
VEKIVDVRGKRLALGTRESSFSYLIPLAMLYDVGMQANDFATVDYLHQEERIALSVCRHMMSGQYSRLPASMRRRPAHHQRSDPVPQLFSLPSSRCRMTTGERAEKPSFPEGHWRARLDRQD